MLFLATRHFILIEFDLPVLDLNEFSFSFLLSKKRHHRPKEGTKAPPPKGGGKVSATQQEDEKAAPPQRDVGETVCFVCSQVLYVRFFHTRLAFVFFEKVYSKISTKKTKTPNKNGKTQCSCSLN